MRVYLDSSALIKRAVQEAESGALETALDGHMANADTLISSSLSWVEVSRALRAMMHAAGYPDAAIQDAIDAALSGIAEYPMRNDVISLARRIAPPVLRSLDAIHLATALLLDADLVLTYDDRLTEACRHNGLRVTAPGR